MLVIVLPVLFLEVQKGAMKIMVETVASLLQIIYGLLAVACIMVVLGVIAWTDVRTRKIPNRLIGALLIIRGVIFLLDVIGGALPHALSSLAVSLVMSVVVTALLIALKALLDRLTHKESLGWGDVKLIAVGCLFLTVEGSMSALFVASIAGLILALGFRLFAHDRTFPFGPALCLGIMVGFFV